MVGRRRSRCSAGMTSSGLTAAYALARAGGSLVTTAQLRAAGCSPAIAERQVRRGAWQRPARGVYVPHPEALTGLELGRAAAALAGARVVVSGAVALQELGARWVPPTDRVLALVDPRLRTPSSGRVELRRTSRLEELETWTRDGVELAPPARAVVDGARGAESLRDARGVVLGAVADGWAHVDELRAHLEQTQRNGSGLTRRAVLDAERGCASPPEAELVDALLGCGLPFYVNPELRLHGRLLGIPDVWLLGLGTGGEVESVERHGHELDVESTYDRHERMTGCGIELVHLSVRRIRYDPGAAADHLLRRAVARRWSATREPAGLVVVPRGPLLR